MEDREIQGRGKGKFVADLVVKEGPTKNSMQLEVCMSATLACTKAGDSHLNMG